MSTRSIRVLAAGLLLPLALVACGSDGDGERLGDGPAGSKQPGDLPSGPEPAEGDAFIEALEDSIEEDMASGTSSTTAPAGTPGDLEQCAAVPADLLSTALGGQPAEVVPTIHDGGAWMCVWRVDGSSLVYAQAWPDGSPQPSPPMGAVDSTSRGGGTSGDGWTVAVAGSYPADPGPGVQEALQAAASAVLGAVASG